MLDIAVLNILIELTQFKKNSGNTINRYFEGQYISNINTVFYNLNSYGYNNYWSVPWLTEIIILHLSSTTVYSFYTPNFIEIR